MNTPVSLDAIREHYDRISPLYHYFWGEHIHHGFWQENETPAAAQENLIAELAAHAAIPRGARVLDLGCGLGGSSFWLARRIECRVVGVTISPVQVDIANRRARLLGLADRTEFSVQDANHLDFAAGSFDAVWSIECTEHVFDKDELFRRCAGILRPGGTLAVCAWLGEPAGVEDQALLSRIRSAMLCPSFGSLDDYVRWMRAAGFAAVRPREVSRHVAPTWTRASALLERPEVRAILYAADRRTREFAGSFRDMASAFACGAMRYGMFAATKPVDA